MIISHRHRFIFVHVPKTAGTAISVYLSRYLGPMDIMIGPWGTAAQYGVRPNLRALYYGARQSPDRMLKALWIGGLPQMVKAGLRARFGDGLWDHATAAQIEQFDPRSWDSYFKFCFVRNPFERVVSIYNWNYRKQESRPSFSEMLRRMEDGSLGIPGVGWDSWPLYTKSDRIAVDFVGRQESLADDMKAVCGRVGIPFDAARITSEKVNRAKDVRSFYGPGDRDRVERIFSKELEAFGYGFPAG
jgi:hypothetical protein